MMNAPLNRERLAKVLALLASPVDGEALAAARMAVKLLADAGMRPGDLAVLPAPGAPVTNFGRWSNFDQVMADIAADLRKEVDALEMELEPHRPPLDWLALADRLRLPTAMEYRARTGKLDLVDRVFIRRALAEAEQHPQPTTRRRRKGGATA